MAKSDTRRPHGSRFAQLPADIKIVMRAAFDKKALHVTVMDLRPAQAFTDAFVICSGQTPRQVKAIAEGIEAALREVRVRASHIEGLQRSDWVLMDYFDFVVHVFTPDTRAFYGLERLWGSADVLDVSEDDLA